MEYYIRVFVDGVEVDFTLLETLAEITTVYIADGKTDIFPIERT